MVLTAVQVQELIREQVSKSGTKANAHGISLEQALVPPQQISVIVRLVREGTIRDRKLTVWLVGQERAADGYKIIMRDDGLQFGLASPGFPADPHLVLDGWYGDLESAFLSM